ncbi:family 1 glycosylhydrolase [uncultured Alsobacter sp.]|uniref:family 1 glycosylhydrolase n=1 Tax=uncultured Alsobacter sp. TaxID=1748258 RepID=UPI0025E571F3|nr:family 1 glycosylhydrolase [uncultured Alsobacter sp.]
MICPSADAAPTTSDPLELWGGLECTVVRVGDTYRDQFEDTRHAEREGDIDLVASLGIRRLRYPVLWETVSPDHPDTCRWDWHDRRLARLREAGIAPIVGLMHHGSGPHYTSLVDPDLPAKLAVHARRVAERYPWVEDWTPVNEPLTTARFSGLYGHWYPHGRDPGVFFNALVHQCRAVAAAMRAIRSVIPHARLVQTEDLGKTFSSPHMAYQADYENERRWLSFDLLCGRVVPGHPLHAELLACGVPAAFLGELVSQPCPPDIVGINHYLTSERYLDEDRERFPPFSWGGNAFESYADVEAVRVHLPDADTGPAARLREVWARYHLPIAVTEAHLGATRDEQLRWLREMWDAAVAVRTEGADIRAVTVWSLFGAVDWNSLLTARSGFYEPGAFDIRTQDGRPRRTALARAAEALARRGRFEHPVLDGDGWWQAPTRFYNPPAATRAAPLVGRARPVLVVGNGRLGRAFAAACGLRGLATEMLGRDRLDPADAEAVRAALEALRPWAVVNCSGWSGALSADEAPEQVWRDNVTGTVVLAQACSDLGIPCTVVSSDQVFDGRLQAPYRESHPVAPLGLFGRSKAEAERAILGTHDNVLIARTGPLFGAGEPDMVRRAVREVVRVTGLDVEGDLVLSPTYIPDLVHAVLDLLIDEAAGVWHLANEGTIGARDFLDRMRLPSPGAPGGGRSALNFSLASERSTIMPPLGEALERHERMSA